MGGLRCTFPPYGVAQSVHDVAPPATIDNRGTKKLGSCRYSSTLLSFVAESAGKMALDVHAVIKHATNADQIGPRHAIEQKMSRLPHQAIGRPSAAATVAQMVAAHGGTEFGAHNTTLRSGSDAMSRKLAISRASYRRRAVSPNRSCVWARIWTMSASAVADSRYIGTGYFSAA
jgi:hypothetical protein